MALDDALRSGTATVEQLRQLEARVDALEGRAVPDNAGIPSTIIVKESGEVEPNPEFVGPEGPEGPQGKEGKQGPEGKQGAEGKGLIQIPGGIEFIHAAIPAGKVGEVWRANVTPSGVPIGAVALLQLWAQNEISNVLWQGNESTNTSRFSSFFAPSGFIAGYPNQPGIPAPLQLSWLRQGALSGGVGNLFMVVASAPRKVLTENVISKQFTSAESAKCSIETQLLSGVPLVAIAMLGRNTTELPKMRSDTLLFQETGQTSEKHTGLIDIQYILNPPLAKHTFTWEFNNTVPGGGAGELPAWALAAVIFTA